MGVGCGEMHKLLYRRWHIRSGNWEDQFGDHGQGLKHVSLIRFNHQKHRTVSLLLFLLCNVIVSLLPSYSW